MHIFVCVDDRLGMLFGGRRLSRDRAVVADLLNCTEGRLIISNFSAELFPDGSVTVIPQEDLPVALKGSGCCFLENLQPSLFSEWIEEITLYRWNRRYPADLYFDLPLAEPPWQLQSSERFPGTSHPEITKEVYRKCR